VGRGGEGASVRSSKELHNQLWAQAAAVGRRIPARKLLPSLLSRDDVIDLHAERMMLRERSRIPGTYWICSVCGFDFCAWGDGLPRRSGRNDQEPCDAGGRHRLFGSDPA